MIQIINLIGYKKWNFRIGTHDLLAENGVGYTSAYLSYLCVFIYHSKHLVLATNHKIKISK